MYRLLKSFLTGVLILCLSQHLFAQTATIDQVIRVSSRGMGPIIQGTEIKGYYMFFLQEKVDRKTYAYGLKIYDANLKEVANTVIEGSKSLTLLEGSYNDNSIMLKFFDYKESKFELRNYDNQGKLVKTIPIEGEKAEMYSIANALQRDELTEPSVMPVHGKGFLNFRAYDKKKMGYDIQFYSEQKGAIAWTFASSPTSEMHEYASYIACSGNTLILQVMRKKNGMTRNMDAFLVGVDLETGKKKFESVLADANYSMFLINGTNDVASNKFYLFGQMTELGDNTMRDNSLGFFSMVIDEAGKMESRNFVFWDKDVSKFLPANEKGRIEEIGHVYFHKIVKTADGKVFAIGEQFQKAVSALGVASKVAAAYGGGTSDVSAIKAVVKDIVIFQFSSDFKLENVSFFAKGKTSILLPSGAGMLNAATLATYIQAYGAFDYAYTQAAKDPNSFIACFVDSDDKEKGEKRKATFKAVSRTGTTYALDKISLETESTFLYPMPAKTGYVMIVEYFRKTKKLTMRLEKLNI